MSDVKDAVIRAAVVKTILDQVKAEHVRAGEALTEHLDPGDRKGAVLPDGTNIGTVSYSQGSAGSSGWAVTDVAALTRWATFNRPDAVQVVTVLADWFTAPANLAALVEATGEVPDGVELVEAGGSAPGVSVRQTAEQKAAALDALARGAIDARTVLALEGGAS